MALKINDKVKVVSGDYEDDVCVVCYVGTGLKYCYVFDLDEQKAIRMAIADLKLYTPTPPPPPPDPDPDPDPPPPPSNKDSFKGLADTPPSTLPHYIPFSASSPFNMKPGRSFHADSAAMIGNLSWSGVPGNFTAIPDDSKDVQHPVFFARESDPTFKVICDGSSNGHTIKIPDIAKFAKGSDGHMQVVQPNGRAYGCWRVSNIDRMRNELHCKYCYWQDYSGLGCVPPGTSASGSGNGGTTASYFDQDAGTVRAKHLLDGRIEHALFVVVSVLASNPSSVWPAAKGDAQTNKVLPSMGDRLILDATESEIRAQSTVKKWEQDIQVAMAEFGGLIGDTGGPGVGFMAESKLSPGAELAWREVIQKYSVSYFQGFGYGFVFKSQLWKPRLKVAARVR